MRTSLMFLLGLMWILAPRWLAAEQVTAGITVRDQGIQSGNVVVDNVLALQQGWIVIYTDAPVHGNPGLMIGKAPVDAGNNFNVVIPIDVSKATPVLHAVLHVDEGAPGKVEYPGPDVPATVDGKIVEASFNVFVASPATPTGPPGAASAAGSSQSPGTLTTTAGSSGGPFASTTIITMVAAGVIVAASLGLVTFRVLARRRE